MKVEEVKCKSILSESKLYGADYSINPYTGCQHGCRYCYAVFMKRFTDHNEAWGNFVDVKVNAVEKLREDMIKSEPGPVLLSSVTDPYQPVEEEYEVTRKILEVLKRTEFPVTILTKNKLVLRDLDIIKEFDPGQISVGFTVNFLDEEDRKMWEPGASSIEERVEALEKLDSKNISTYIHIGPWFEGITNLEEIVERVEDTVLEVQIENLNPQRGKLIKKTVDNNYPELSERYRKILRDGSSYREKLSRRVEDLRSKFDVPIKLFLD